MKKFVFVVALLFAVNAYAADAKKSDKQAVSGQPSEAQMQEMMKAGAPNENHKVLETLSGKWKHEVTYWMAADGEPMKMTGTNTNKMIMNGRFLEQDVKGNKMPKTGNKAMDEAHAKMPVFQGLGLTGYDNIRKEYTTVWLDNMATGIMNASAQFNEKNQSFAESGTVSCPMTGEKNRAFRGITTINDKNHYTYEMYMKDPKSGKEFKSMEIAYTRMGK